MEWNDLRFVLAIARGGSLAAASRSLELNISTVYRRLEGLEKSLDVQLFERVRDRYRITTACQALVEAGERIDREVEEAARRIKGADGRLEGPLRLSTGRDVAYHLLPRHLADFGQAYPSIALEVGVTDKIVDLNLRDVDVVIRDAPRAPDHLVGRKVARLGIAAYVAPSLLKRLGTDPCPESLPWLGLQGTFAALPQVRTLLGHVASSPIRMCFDSLEALRKALVHGVGVGVLPCFVGDSDERLVRVPDTHAPTDVHLWVLAHPDLRRSARVRAFLQFFGTRFERERAELLGDNTRQVRRRRS